MMVVVAVVAMRCVEVEAYVLSGRRKEQVPQLSVSRLLWH